MKKRPSPSETRKPLFEELERRILMSADIPALLDPSLASGGDPAGQFELVQDTEAAAQLDRHELVFVDTSIEDYEVLVDDLRSAIPEGRNLEVILLDRERDGIEQITDFLNDYEGLDAIHIVSHGSEGAAQLGSGWLTSESLDGYASSIASWSDALSDDADLLFYGCNLAGGESGAGLVESLAKLTGADVAASTDETGAAALGGDWVLESSVGDIESSVAFSAQAQQSWASVLAAPPAGGEFRVNTTTSDTQQTYTGSNNTARPVAMDADGDFVVVWQSLNQDGDGWGIYGQRYDSAGVAQGTEFRVNDTTTGNQEHAAVAMDDAGNFVVTWMSDHGTGTDIYAQRYDAAGTALGSEFLINETTISNQANSELAMDASGNFVVVWESNHSGNNEIYSRRYSATGTPLSGEVHVNTFTAQNQNMSSIAMDDAGNYVIVWNSYGEDGDGFGIFAQRYNATGVAQASNFQVNSTTTDSQERASVAMDADGDFVVVWKSLNQDGSGYGVYAQRYDAAGVAQGGELAVNTETANNQRDPAVAMDAAGNFTVTWSSQAQDGSGWGIYAQEYDTIGNTVGAEFRVNTTTASDQKQSGLAMDAAGDFVVVWTGSGTGDASGLFAQRYGNFVTNVAPVAANDPGSFSADVQALSPLSYWRLGETSGTSAVDLGSAGVTGTYSGASQGENDAINGDPDAAAGFIRTEQDSIDIPHDDAYLIDDGTIQLWFNANDLAQNQAVFSKDSTDYDTGGHLSMRLLTDGSLSVRLQSTTTSYTVSSVPGSVTAGSWHQVAFSFGSGGMELYLDGVLVDTDAYTGGLGTSAGGIGNYEPITIGANNWSSGDGVATPLIEHFDGRIDEVAIFGSALSGGQIKQLSGSALQNYTLGEDGSLSVPAGEGVLVNDFDAEGDALTAILVSGPSNAAAFELNADGSFSYTPTPDFNGTDTFTYKSNDGTSDSNVATVTITVNSINDAPTAANETVSTNEDIDYVFTAADFNFSDVDAGDTLQQVQITTLPSVGALKLAGVDVTLNQLITVADINAGNLTFTPVADQNGAGYDSFEFKVSDTAPPGSVLSSFAAPVVNSMSGLAFDGTNVWLTGQSTNTIYELDTLGNVISSFAGPGTNPTGLTFDGTNLWVVDRDLNTIYELDTSGNVLSSFATPGTDSRGLTWDGTNLWLVEGTGSQIYELTTTGTVVSSFAWPDNYLRGITFDGTSLWVADQNDQLIYEMNTAGSVLSTFAAPGTGAAGITFDGQDFWHADTDVDSIYQIAGPGSPVFSAAAYTMTIDVTAVNDAPILGTNALTISEGGTVVLSAANLAATDVDTADPSLTFTVSSVTGGQFELVASPGAPITSFTQAQITSGAVQFVHGGGEGAPSYDVTVDDGALSDGPSAASISFTNQNDAPVLGTNALTIAEGGSVILSAANLAATDVDTADPSLTFTVSSVTAGQFELVASPGAPITSFTQAQITSGAVQFVHDGGEGGPSYDVTVDDGALSDGPAAASISFTNQNDAPVLGTNALTISEGGTVILSAANLAATDADTADPSLSFTVSSVTGGQFELVASPGAPITSFTQAQITSGAVQFVHGGGEAAPSYDVTVDDGALNDGPSAASISFTNQNDAPVLGTNALTISEGGTVILSAANLVATDVDTADPSLSFTVSSVTGGQFELVASPGAPITSFTQAQITSGAVQFVHDGGEAAPSYNVTVDDGALSDGPAAASISFTNQNDAPVLGTNALTISEGGTVILSAANLAATDADTADPSLSFTVSSVTGGQFELVASPGAPITSFTQAQITSGAVQFVHDGGEVTPSYDVTVDDGALSDGPSAASISFTNQNDAPVLGTNALTISEGGTVILSAANLGATDVDTADPSLNFTVSSVAGGQFELVASPGVLITSFTQAQITSGAVQFVHDGGEGAPSYDVTVDDGALNDGPSAASISFTNQNDAPVLGTNALTISEGGTVILSAANLAATDADTADPSLSFTVSSVTGGQFELVASPGAPITSFTQAQITSGAVQFVHDGGEGAPSYNVTVDDGALSDGPSAASISFTNQNDAPVLGTNSLTILEGGTVVLSAANLAATDVDTADPSLSFTVSSVTAGQFELVASPGAPITSFTQAQITSGAVQFVHDGGEGAPSYDVTVDDGALSDGPSAASISFTNQNDAPVLGTNALTISEGGTVILSAANLAATDVETADSSLTFTVSSVTAGQFELVASPGVPVTSFTQAQITSGAVQFVHDGGEGAPSYNVTVDDGALSDGPSAASISFTNQNDAPVLGTNSLTILEGGTVVLSAANLAATDVDTADPSLSFTVSSVMGGQFELVASPGAPITSFTQAQITSGAVQFVHDGGEGAPSYDVTVDDGALNDGPSAASISFTNQNDAPVLGTNALTISEGGTVILSAANLAATDVETADSSLTFTVSSVTAGQFELVASPGVPVTSFTQAQITSGAVQFVHDGGEGAPSYNVTVDDGALSDGPSAASISFTNQNDAPVLGTNALTISEGGTIVLSAANLSATDVDTADPSLTFTVSSVTGGQFELVASPGAPITSFTQAQITSGAVQFVHDGGEVTPSYDVTVDDGALSDGPSAAAISFTNQNDAPVLGTNALTISEGGTVILSAANLGATDVDTADPSLNFTVSSVAGGQFELVASPGVLITSFTQAQITSGAVQFVHDGGEGAPSYDVTVDDGALNDGPSAASISYTNQNDAPVLGTNALTISEGGTVILTAANLAATDADTADPSLSFTVSSVTGGQFELVASPGALITSFTQAQITSGAVQFVHDGGEAAPSYDVTVDDGALNDGPSAASISFTNQNDAPVLGTNALTISEGDTVILSAANLAATDVDTADPSLSFTVSSVIGGQFELVASPGVPITSFTQAQITSGAVQFVHDGGEAAPSYDVTVDDGALNDGPSAASISFTNQNDAPVLGTNALTISEGDTVILSAANLAATDADTADPSLTFTISSVAGGQFELVASPGVLITSFTQAQITSGAVQFVHDGGEGAPSYNVTVDDGALNDGPSAASISFTNQNDAPVLGTNALTISEGGTVILSAANLAATDADTADPSLTFTISSVTGGQFELVASPGVPITSFTQAQITSGAVQFVHDGAETAPSYDVTVDDGALNDGPNAAAITYTGQNDAPVLGTNALTIAEGGTVILSAANLAATDVDTADSSLTFTVSSVTGGQFELVASPGVLVTSFTQAQITSGAVQFVHDGGETAPSYNVTVDDGALSDGPTAASISFTNQNDAPVLGTNALTISEGGTVVLSAANLAATDVDTADPSLSFTVSSVTGGQFELVASPGAPITSFTQAQITAGDIQFVHDGGEAAASYDVTVDDGSLSDGPSAAAISFTNQNDAPVLGTNALTISEAGTVILSAANLGATDVDTADPSLTFTVSSVTGGQFELVASPGAPITSFTQAQITSGAVQFVHDGGEGAPSYDVTVDDGALSDGPSAASISFTNQNDAPVLGTNALTIGEGGTVILSAANLAATDVETADASLTFTVSSVTGGQFELVASPGASITSFTQAQITGGAVQFVHDGGEAAPGYDVTVDDGALSDGPQAAAISFTNQNDAPVLGTNALSINEGGTVVLSAASLAATDPDTADSSLSFSVSSVSGGQFELVASPGVPITSFTQAQITSGAVQFVHDGGETAPSYDVTVDDGSLSDGPSAAAISFTNQNDAPVLGTNALTIAEGGTVILSAANVTATDVDTADPSLSFTVSSVTGGQFELVASPGVPVTSFTQAQITSGAVQFVHDGGEAAPSYDVTVDDGALNDGPSAASVSFTNQNDAPVLGTNALTIAEGGTVILSAGELAASDVDDADSSLGFTVSSLSGGQFELVASPGVAITGFSQAQVTSGAVRFVHDGGEAAPSYDVTVDDGSLSDGFSAAISFSNQNDAPVLGTNALTIADGGTVILSASELAATDVDNADASLLFSVSAVTEGQFELVTTPGAAITSFTQAQVSAGDVQFVHAGTQTAPGYNVLVSDGLMTDSGPASIVITPGLLSSPPTDDATDPEGVPDGQASPIEESTDLGAPDIANPVPSVTPAPEVDPIVLDHGQLGQLLNADVIASTASSGSANVDDGRAQSSAHPARAQLPQIDSARLIDALDQMGLEMNSATDSSLSQQETVISTIEGMTIVASAGLIAAIVRSGSLVALAASSLPLWKGVDPLAILYISEEERDRRARDVSAAQQEEDREYAVGQLLDRA